MLKILIATIGLFLITTITPVSADYSASELLQLHNSERLAAGLEPLSINSKLNTSAKAKAQLMLDSDCWSHYCGGSPWDSFIASGYYGSSMGENLGEGFKNSKYLMRAWMASPGHRTNVLEAKFNEVGFGVVEGPYQGDESSTIVVVHFGGRRNIYRDFFVQGIR